MARYSAEFKKNAVSLFKREGITKTCRQLRVTRATVYRWVNQDISSHIGHSENECGAAAESKKRQEAQFTER